jgi:hypothetical protein
MRVWVSIGVQEVVDVCTAPEGRIHNPVLQTLGRELLASTPLLVKDMP